MLGEVLTLFGDYVGAVLPLRRICNCPTLAGEQLALSEFTAEESPAGWSDMYATVFGRNMGLQTNCCHPHDE